MTIDEAKRELKNYLADKETYRAGVEENEEILRLRAKAEGTTVSYEPQYGSGHSKHSKIEECAVKIADNELCKDLIKEGKRLEKVNRSLHKVSNPYRQILFCRFLEGKSLRDTALDLDLDYWETSRKQNHALVLYAKIRGRS